VKWDALGCVPWLVLRLLFPFLQIGVALSGAEPGHSDSLIATFAFVNVFALDHSFTLLGGVLQLVVMTIVD